MNWKFFASMAAGMLESAGVAKQMEDEDSVGKDDMIGDGLVYAAKLIRWLISPKGAAPKAPDAFK